MKLILMLFALVVLLTASTVVQAQSKLQPCSAKPFLAANAMGRVHYAIAAGCAETSSACGQKSRELMDDCEFRGEDGGTVYTSCECQGVREYKACMAEGGCSLYSEYIRIQNDYWYCFIQ